MEDKVEDKVRCIRVDNLLEGELTLNKEYTILGFEKSVGIKCYRIKNDCGNIFGYFACRFEKVGKTKEITYEVIKPFGILNLWDKFKDNYDCKEFQKAWGVLLICLISSPYALNKLITEFKENDLPTTLWKYRDKLEEKGFIKKVKKDINLKPGMRLKIPQTKFTYRIINCSELSSNMTYFNILVEENNFCYDFGKIFSCSTLEELNEITGEIFEVINEKE